MLRLFKSRGSTYTTSKSTVRVPWCRNEEVPGAEGLQFFKENPSKISRSQIEAASELGRGFSLVLGVSFLLTISIPQNSRHLQSSSSCQGCRAGSGLHEMSMYTNRKPVLCRALRSTNRSGMPARTSNLFAEGSRARRFLLGNISYWRTKTILRSR